MKFLLLLILMVMFVWQLFVIKKQIMLPSFLLSLLLIFNVVVGLIWGVLGLSGFTLITIYSIYVLLFFFHWSKVKFKLVKNPLLWITIIFFLLILIIDALLYESWRYAQLGRQLAVWDYDFGLIIWTIVPLLFMSFFLNKDVILKQIIYCIPILGVLFYLLALSIMDFSIIDVTDRFSLQDSAHGILNSISLSRFSSIIFISSFVLLIEKNRYYSRIFLLLLAVFSFSFIFISGQRGTILAVAVVFMLYLFLSNGKVFFRLFPFLVILGVIVNFAFSSNFMGLSDRFAEFEDVKSLGRVMYYVTSWEIFADNDFFYPEGSLGYSYIIKGHPYPHNVFLEAMVEYGLFGLIISLFIYVIGGVYSIKILRSKYSDSAYKVVVLVWIALGISALVSANISMNRLFFIFSGLLGIAHYHLKKREMLFIAKF